METKEETLSEIHQAWEFCNERSRSVEVCYRNMDDVKIITRVHFQFDPVVSTVYVLSLLLVCVCALHVWVWVCTCMCCTCICVACLCVTVCTGPHCVQYISDMLFIASYHIPHQFSWKSAVPQNTLSHNLVERVKWNVNRDSAEDKHRDFMKWMKAVKKETSHQVRV